MFRRIWKNIKLHRRLLSIVLIMVLLFPEVGIALAQGHAYAFGYKWITNVRGLRLYVWTGQRPSGLIWTASPLVVCQSQYCNTKAV